MTDFVAVKSPQELIDETIPWSQQRHPLETAGWWSYLTIGWMNALIRKGSKALLTEEDIWPMAQGDSVDTLYCQVMRYWKTEQKPKIHAVLWRAFTYRIVVSFVLFGLYALLSLLQPIAVKSMMQFLQHDDLTKSALGPTNGYVLALLLFIISLVSVCIMDFAGFYAVHLASNMKSVVSHMVYLKTLALSGKSKSRFSSGEVVTMSSVDVERINLGFSLCHWAFLSPIMLVIIYIMLGFELGVLATLIGGLAMAACMLVGFTSAAKVGHYRQNILKVQAERVKLTNEVLQGIRVVKLYAWEISLQEQLNNIRLRELSCLTKYHSLRIFNGVVLMVAPVLSLAFCLMVYVARGNELTTQVAFTALAYMNITRQPCSVFSVSIIGSTEALASCRRLTEFLNADEVDEVEHADPAHKAIVEISQGEFSWDRETPTLKNINLQVKPNTLTIVVGAVGSGKSSLLSAILGDIHATSGTRNVHAKFSYVSQESWIQHASVKQNILFDSALDDELYRQVVAACQLHRDFTMLPKGDETEIGERGLNLSGGQKARVSLARAIYHQEADAYLLDDPLSALDVHVANSVFRDGVRGLLGGKTTVLVLTSHYHLLSHADRILLMSDGSIIGDGSYDDIVAKFPHLMNMMPATKVTPVEDQEEQQEDDKKTAKSESTLVAKEDNVKGQISWTSYKSYLGASGYNAYLMAFSLTMLYTISQVALSLTDWFMSLWARNDPFSLAWGYVGLAITSIVLVYGRSMFVLLTAILCSKNFHSRVLRNVLSAPVPTFFDVTPVGRILNRFSSDLDQIDSTLPHYGLNVLQFFFNILAVLVVCAASTPWVILLYVPFGALFVYGQRAYNRASNEIKRLDGVTRSPLISIVSETYQGLSVIRAFDKTKSFTDKQRLAVDNNMRFNMTYYISARWFQMRLDVLGAMIVGGCAFVAVLTKSSVGLDAAGLSLTYSTQLSILLSRLAVFSSWVENVMTSAERLNHYNTLEKEDPIPKEELVNWPSQGAIAFEGYSMRYREHLDLVLNDIAFAVESGHQVGICGRTGSGKSSLMAALFRMVPSSSGRITIDGVDIASVSLKRLRSGLTIIPQDPVLFSGSIRLNLNPTNDADDADLWPVLKRVHLSDAIPSLEFEIAEKGSNLSVGQRQLVCIARALLRRSKVVVLDEATANIDPESDRLIQQTMRECFENVTRLIIAHRLDTIMDSDRILVLDAGTVKEYGTPSQLLANKDGAFAQLAQHANIDVDKLR